MILVCMLFSGISIAGRSQSDLLIKEDSIVDNNFFGGTNDYVYIKGRIHYLEYSPLSLFDDYYKIYIPIDKMCFTTYAFNISDKEYEAIWAIVDNRLYLADIMLVCYEDPIVPTFADYVSGFSRGLTFSDFFLLRMNPLEELTGRRFEKKLPAGFYPWPLGSGYVIPATWFSGAVKVRLEDSPYYYSPYQQLVFEEGKLISVQQLIYHEYIWNEAQQKMVYKKFYVDDVNSVFR